MRNVSRQRHRKVGRPPGPRPDEAQRRAELLDAAARAIRRLGAGASMADIAAEADLTKPILYAHFGDKAGLATALSERFTADLVPQVLGAFEKEIPATEMVREAIDAFIAWVEREPELYRFLVRGVAGGASSFVDQNIVSAFGTQLSQVLRTGLRNAGADSGPAEVWSFSILAAVFAGAEWWLERKTMSRADLVDYLATLVWNGASQAALGTPQP
jgi:AcrR family transcriptional regulator